MARSFFIPARNSRHRIAAIALYRALLRSARQVEIPQDAKHPTNPGHPVVQVVRKRFEGNKGYTSLRLVYSSMTAGYKFLTLLTQAQTPNSPEHSQIISFLRKRNNEAASRAAKRNSTTTATPPTPNPDTSTTPKNTPLLTRVSGPDEPPEYVGKPRPINSPTRKRRVPVLCADCYGQPFLRYSKPHPPLLDKMVRKRRIDWQTHIAKVREVEDVLTQEAILEDDWESLVDELLAQERLHSHRTQTDSMSESYLYTAMLVKLWSEWRLESMWIDWTARGTAMQKLIEDERILAEAQNTTNEPDKSNQKAREPPKKQEKQPSQNLERARPAQHAPKPKVFVQTKNRTPAIDAANATRAEYLRKGWSTEPRDSDPYSTPLWAGLVTREESRLRKRMREARATNSNPNFKVQYNS